MCEVPYARNGDVELYYEMHGEHGGEPLVLVMGLGAHIVAWDSGFVDALCARGFRVISFDNRDVGYSTHLEHLGEPNVIAVVGGMDHAPYTLVDMAGDVMALLDAESIAGAHLIGASMGGMIVQTAAIEHPERVLSMTSIMSTMSGDDYILPAPEVLALGSRPTPTDRESFVEQSIEIRRVIGSKPLDEEFFRERARIEFDRAVDPAGVARQLSASLSAAGRREALGRLDMPVLVVHGEADALVIPENGRRTQEAIPGAEGLYIEDMGHDIPRFAWNRIVGAIERTARRQTRTAS